MTTRLEFRRNRFLKQRSDSTGNPRPDLWRRGIQHVQRMQVAARAEPAAPSAALARATYAGVSWVPIGPQPIRVDNDQIYQGVGPDSGEVTDIAIDPSVVGDQTIYIAANNGGIWKTTDGGLNWHPKTDFMPSLSMGAIALDPVDRQIVYAGTGNKFDGGAQFSKGAGIYRSIDGGETWSQLGKSLFADKHIIRIVLPATKVLLVATDYGLFRSVDGSQSFGANAPAFNDGNPVLAEVNIPFAATLAVNDLALDKASPGTVYATVETKGIFVSTDGGITFPTNLFSNPGAPQAPFDRISFAQSTHNPDNNTLYALVTDEAAASRFKGLFRSTDKGLTWGKMNAADAAAAENGGLQADYDLTIGVDPQDANRVYFGFQELYLSKDGGSTLFTPAAGTLATSHNKIHWDHHAIVFTPNPVGATTSFYVGTDGGIARSSDGGATFANLNETIATNLFLGVDIGRNTAANNRYSYGGTQDTGTLGHRPDSLGTDWHLGIDGDGGPVAVDPNNPLRVYGQDDGNFITTSDGGASWTFPPAASTHLPPDPNGSSLGAPRGVDPNSSATVYVSQAAQLFRSTNTGATFTLIHTFPADITAFANVKLDSNILMVGCADGSVHGTADAGANWVPSLVIGAPALPVGAIAIDPTDVGIAVVGYSGFTKIDPANRTKHVFRTTNAGVSFSDISGTDGGSPDSNLPDLPIHSIVIDASTVPSHGIIVATDSAVVCSVDNGATWQIYGVGLPNTDCTSLAADYAVSPPLIRLGTYGRSAFELQRLGGARIAVHSNLAFGNVAQGAQADLTFDVFNVGDATLTISGIADASANPNYSLVSPPAFPFDIVPGGQSTFTLRFAPTSSGKKIATYSIASNDATQQMFDVAVSGESAATGPQVSGVVPFSGPPAGGTTVLILGSGFTGATAVMFGTAAATQFTVVNDTRISAVSPAGTSTVDVSVVTPGGTTGANPAAKFTYIAANAASVATPVRALGLYDLLAPEFLAGFSFPSHIDQYLSLLAVSGLTMTSDDSGVLYTGTVYFPTGSGNPPPATQHADPSGAIFEWSDVNFQFRLRAWREGSGALKNVVDAISSGSNNLQALFDNFGTAGSSSGVSDYPGFRFRLELLVSVLTFHLGSEWVPGTVDSTYHVVKDTTAASTDVRVLLPKMLLRYEQPEDFSQAPTFALDSWGSEGFDAPSDLAEGQLVTMDPPLALHTSGRVAFSVQDVVLDLSQNDTPPEILSHFGTGDDFTGIYIKALQFYYSDSDKDFAFNISVNDALISFQGKVWLEAELDLLFDPATHPAAGGLTVSVRFLNGSQPIQCNASTQVAGQTGVYQGGSITAPANVYLQLQVSGGIPPYTYAVDFTPSGGSVVHMWDGSKNQAYFQPPPATDASGMLAITVTDSTAGTALTYTNTMSMNVTAAQSSLPNGAPEDNTASSNLAPATIAMDARPSGIPDGYQIGFTPNASGNIETLVVQGGPDPVTAMAGGNPVSVSASRQILVEVDAGANVTFAVTYPAQGSLPGEFDLLFGYNGPPSDTSESSYVAGVPSPDDPVFDGNTVPAAVPSDGSAHSGEDALAYWVKNALDLSQNVSIEGRASYEGDPTRAPYNQALSQRRLDIAQQIATGAGANIGATSATGQTVAQNANRIGAQSDRVAILTGTGKPGQPAYTLSGVLARAASPSQPTVASPPPPPATPATPPAASNSSKPPSLRRLSFRVRLEKNIPVLMEISGEIDFQHETQAALQSAPGSDPNGDLGLTNAANRANATANTNAGPTIVDFTLNVTYDTATNNLTETLTLGAAPADQNGLLQMQNAPDGSGSYDTFKNIFGAVLVFTPILNAATTAIDPNSAGEWSDLAISLGPPIAIGGLGWINTVSVTLYGGSLVVRENVPSGLSSTKFTAAALTFDYGVSFRFDIDPLDIHSSRNLSVRYKAVGFSLDFAGSPAFKFVFDTSKGYTLDLSDPSLFNLPSPLGDLLKIAEARIAQHNPLTLEVDLVIKADLGVITVDEFQIKIPLDGMGAPMILPSGIHVNVPGAVTGGGSVHIQQGGFEGGFDLTLVPLQLRIAAQVGVKQVTDGTRNATAFYLGMEVDFPTPIVLGTSGLGIFGLFGLFAMHYMRNLPAAVPGSAVGPDLQWLVNSGGQPQFLYNQSNPAVQNWIPKVGNWAIGIGALLGTLDGYLLNMRGMFVLTLPGPQIVITVNLQIVTDLPGGDDGVDTNSLTVGILGILDIDFNLNQITIGVSTNFNIDNLIGITVPISIFFSWDDPDTWHVWLGTIQTPISANILGITKGSGYFMIGGQPITPFPPNSSSSLPGVAVAVGFSASIIWGSEDVDIYLEVVVGADLGVSFSPHLFIVGDIHLSGKLQLLVVSIGASGDFQITAPNPVYLHVTVCGSVSFFFFSVSACVEFSIGTQASPLPPPPLISRMYLQSYAPVIPSGQGGSRPIDASLGNAVETVTTPNILSTLPPAAAVGNLKPVPIDTVPVLQLDYAVDASTIANSFTTAVPQCAALPTSTGGTSVSLGGGRKAVYVLRQLTISPPLPSGDPPPPAVWRKNTSGNDMTATRVDLALFSRDPNLASHALERSTTLNGQLTSSWGGVCDPIAPPACVLWTFCGQPLGSASNGWNLVGIPTPDPPGTTRSSPVPIGMQVEGPVFANARNLLAAFGPVFGGDAYQPARIIGFGYGYGIDFRRCLRALELPELVNSKSLTEIAKSFAGDLTRHAGAALKQLQAQLATQQANWRWVRLHAGASTQVRLYMALNRRLAHVSYGTPGASPILGKFDALLQSAQDNSLLKAANQLDPVDVASSSAGQRASGSSVGFHPLFDVLIRERDASGALLRESTLESLNPNLVLGMTGLPAEWTDPAGPWRGEIEQVVTYMDGALQTLAKVFVQFAPLPQTTIIEVAEVGPALLNPPTVVIGAVEACPLSELQRYELGIEVQNGQVATLEGYLSGGSPVPLLAPNTTYTITVEYDVATTEADGTTVTHYNNVQQGFTFQTDAAPPPKLDPWVMSCSPANNELNVFYNDPVVVVFNDQEAIQLFNAYNYQLVLDLRAADGLNDPAKSVSNTTSISGFGPAGYDSLLNLVQEGLLPCVGSTTAYHNQQYTADVQLRPCMAYTLDIATDPAVTPALPAGQAVVPLYRTRFTTSKYASLSALAHDLGGSRVVHNHLNGPLTLPTPSGGQANAVADQDIESAFQAAGEQALPAPNDNAITIYWVPKGGSGPFVPYCILIDCTEPLWRVRQEPSLVPVDPGDPSFNIVKITTATALEVKEAAGSNIAGYLYSTSGTRTIAFFSAVFSPPPAGATVTLELHRPASMVFGLADSVATIIALPIGPQAPWEADHV